MPFNPIRGRSRTGKDAVREIGDLIGKMVAILHRQMLDLIAFDDPHLGRGLELIAHLYLNDALGSHDPIGICLAPSRNSPRTAQDDLGGTAT